MNITYSNYSATRKKKSIYELLIELGLSSIWYLTVCFGESIFLKNVLVNFSCLIYGK